MKIDGTRSYACPVGAGYIDIGEILHRLQKQRYSGNVIVELYDYHPKDMLAGIRQSVRWVRNYLAL
ncbi:MAG: hypothetical protein IJ733_14765 [Lachnospiraceae bacterium]|nr:hypothetical protein [Lachnospiraceae bacterium]